MSDASNILANTLYCTVCTSPHLETPMTFLIELITIYINPPKTNQKAVLSGERKNGVKLSLRRTLNPCSRYILPSMLVQCFLHSCIYVCLLCATGVFRKDNHSNLNTLPWKAVRRDIIMFKRTMRRIYIHNQKS